MSRGKPGTQTKGSTCRQEWTDPLLHVVHQKAIVHRAMKDSYYLDACIFHPAKYHMLPFTNTSVSGFDIRSFTTKMGAVTQLNKTVMRLGEVLVSLISTVSFLGISAYTFQIRKSDATEFKFAWH